MKLQQKFLLVGLMLLSLGVNAQDAVSQPTVAEPRILRGNDKVIAVPAPAVALAGGSTGFKFEEAPLADVLALVLREIVKVDYVVHPPIAGTVTLSTQANVTADQAMALLEAALQANGVLMARDTRGTYHIGRPDALKSIVPAVRQAVGSSPLPPGYGAVVLPLKFIGAGEMAAILRPMAPPEAIVRVDTLRNLLVLVGTRTQAEGWLDIVATFDVDILKGMSVGVFPLKYVSTQEVEDALRMLNSASGAAAPAGVPAGAAKPSDAASAQLSAGFPLYGALRILPIARINSVMVVTPRASYLDEARRWIEKLDQPGGNSTEAQLFTYSVQNGNAQHLAEVLNGLFGTGATTAPTTATSGVAPGLAQTNAFSAGSSGAFGGALGSGTFGTGQSVSTIKGNGLTPVSLASGLRVIADEINNVVLVYGTKSEYAKIETTLKKLDVPPTQVLIEASIIEVTLNDDLKYGLQWVFNDPERGGLTGLGKIATVGAATLFDSASGGFSYSMKNAAGDVRGVLNALADKSLVKVISSPSLMVLDNHLASISVGTQQPVRSGETITAGGNVTSSIQYKDTGVILSVTPSVNAGNMVSLQINQSVTDVGAPDLSAGNQRTFLQRQFSSKVAVRSGETLVLGGLIRDNTTTGKSGLPFLQDLPLIGKLFGANTSNTNRTELIVMITPRVVRTEQDVRKVGQDLKDQMKALFPPPPPPLPPLDKIPAY